MNPTSSPEARFAGRFAEWSPIAGGAEGRLFRVRDRWTGRVVALKTGEGDVGRAAVLHEYALLSRLRHPCLLGSLGLVWDGDSPAHLLEYVPAIPPESLWSEGGEAAVRSALVQALRGLTYLHRQGWVHADVAPGNILVWREGARWRAKVADLGLCLPAGQAAGLRELRGTPDTISPEGARGEGLAPASDLYSLAATAVTWIDGLASDAEVEVPTLLRERARVAHPVGADRPVSAELRRSLAELGAPDPAARSANSVRELGDDEATTGPPVLEGGLHGVESTVLPWAEEFRTRPAGAVSGLLLAGRVGSGRHTALDTLSRGLVMQGWAELSGLPFDTLRDWLDAEGETDPVRLARALVDRFRGRNVVVLWPANLSDVGFRLLQAFLIARGEVSGETRTVVLAVRGGEESQEAWLTTTLRAEEREWNGPGDEALRSLAADLWAEETGEAPMVEGWTPLAVVARRRRGLSDGDIGPATQSVEDEVRSVWAASPGLREAFALLAWSGGPVFRFRLVTLFGEETVRRLEEHTLTRTGFGEDRRYLDLADWLVREALVSVAEDREVAERVASRLGEHPGEAPPAALLALAIRGAPVSGLLGEAARQALDQADYETAVELFRVAEEFPPDGLPAVLAAARKIGRLPEEAEVLRRLAARGGAEELRYRRELVRPLTALGEWEEALAACREIVARAPEGSEDALWSRLQEAELLWQWGRGEDADVLYDDLQRHLPAKSGLWVKYAVGRARSAGQRGEFQESRRFLSLGMGHAGEELMESDSYYWNTLAGIQFELATIEEGIGSVERAVEVAERDSDWQVLVMSKARLVAVLLDHGREYPRAEGAAREAYSIATAFGSSRMAAICGCYLGSCLAHIGHPEAAYQLGLDGLSRSEILQDRVLKEVAIRPVMMAGVFYGQEDWVEEGLGFRDSGTRALVAGIDLLHAVHLLSLGQPERADALVAGPIATWTESAPRRVLEGELIRLEALVLGGKVEEAAQLLEDLAAKRQLGIYSPIADVMRATIRDEPVELGVLFDRLMEERRLFLICHLADLAMEIAPPEDRSRISRNALAAIRAIADSFSDQVRRKAFLSLPRHASFLRRLSA